MSMVLNEQQMTDMKSFNEESEIFKLFKDCHEFAFRAWSPFLKEAQKDLACYLGDQWEHNDRAYLESQKRNALVFNRVRRNVKMITGFERKSRNSLIAQPVENSDELASNQLSAVLLWLYNSQNFANINSDAFEGALKTGINLLQLSMDFTDDPIDGDIKLKRVPYNAFLLDPRFTERDLSDCEFIIQRRVLSKEAVKALIPFRADDIELLDGTGPDGRFPMFDGGQLANKKKSLKYDEFWVREFREEKVLIDKISGNMRILDPKKTDIRKLQFAAENVENLEVIDKRIPTVKLNILVEGIVMFSGEDPWKIGDFPHVPVMAFWDPEHSANNSHFHDGTPGRDDLGHFFSHHHSGDFALKLQSLVRPTRDPQTEANKRRSKMLDIIDSQLNSGWIAKEGSVKNKNSLYRGGQGEVVWLDEMSQPGDLQKVPPADIPAGLFQLSQQMDNDIVEIAGVTDELLGLTDDSNLQMSGVLAKLKQGAGLTVLQDLFDNYRLSQKLLGGKLIKMIQKNWSPQKIARIINDVPAQEFFTKKFGKYDISVEESMETPSQRALAYAQLMQARQAGIAVPDSIIIDFMPLQDKAKLKEAIEQQEQQQAQIQQQQLEDQTRLRELQRAKVFSDIGLGIERIARAEADRGLARERISELQENQANAVLERFKAIKEIQGMDDDRLMRLLRLVQAMEEGQKQQAEGLQQGQGERAEDQFGQALGFVRDQSAIQPGVQLQQPGAQLLPQQLGL